jgi:hypothetical protein
MMQAAVSFYYTQSLPAILAYDSPENSRLSTDENHDGRERQGHHPVDGIRD